MPDPQQPTVLAARALLVGERLDLRGLGRAGAATSDPLQIALPGVEAAFAMRWGALVLFGANEAAEAAALESLRARMVNRMAQPVEEKAVAVIGAEDGVEPGGTITLAGFDPARLAVVADVLAKSAALSHQETSLAGTLDGMEPVIARLKRLGRVGVTSRSLLRAVGSALDARSRATARVDADGKPDVLWDNPALEPLHARLVEEFELRERAGLLDRKLALVGETVQSLLQIIEARRSLGLEIAIVVLIAIEVVTTLYEAIAG